MVASQNKRAREEIVVQPFDAIDLEQLTLKDRGEDAKGGDRTFPLLAGKPIRFNLTPSGWLTALYGFDLSSKFNQPSFLIDYEQPANDASEEKKKPKTEGLNMRIHLQQKQTDFLRMFDEKCKIAFCGIEKTCSKWGDLVTSGNMMCPNSVKVFVPLKANDKTAALTEIAVVDGNTITRGEGWNFIEPYVNDFRNADVKVTVRVKRIWFLDGKAGITLEATQLALRIRERRPKEAVAFTDDDLLA